MLFERFHSAILNRRLDEPPRHLIVVSGPRQVGKTTLVQQVLRTRPKRYLAADRAVDDLFSPAVDLGQQRLGPGAVGDEPWLVQQWSQARLQAKEEAAAPQPFVLAIDEIQKVPRWSEVVKGLWDEDRANGLRMHVVLLGSSPWLMQRGLAESLAGRFELLQMSHWSFSEMQEAFDFSLDEYLYFGGYPGSAAHIRDESRWRDYVRGSLVQTSIERDILGLTRVHKPALLKRLFELGCAYSGQIVSYTKLQGQLQDAGNTVTLADYLDLLGRAGLLAGLPKFAGRKHRQRAASPKLNALNTALISALSGYTFAEARSDRSHWGRLVESAVGAHLCNTARDTCEVQYWRESPHEVDFVLTNKRRLVAIEVKSGSGLRAPGGLAAFVGRYVAARPLVVGESGIPLAQFLARPAVEWLEETP